MPTQSPRIIWFQSLSMINWRLSKFLIRYAFHCSQSWRMPKKLIKCVIHSKKWKNSIDFVREGRTSMSPRSHEMNIFFEKWRMYLAFCRVLGRGWTCGAGENLGFLVQKSVSKMLYTWKRQKKWCVRVGGAHIDVTTLERKCYFFQKLQMYLAFCKVLGHLKSRKKVCQIDDTCETLKNK